MLEVDKQYDHAMVLFSKEIYLKIEFYPIIKETCFLIVSKEFTLNFKGG